VSRARLGFVALVAATIAIVLAHAAPAPAAPPSIRAPAAILVEPATGDVVFQRQATKERPVASTTKLMTALVTLEHAKLSRVLTTVRYRGAPAESVIGLRAGERMTVADLLRGLLMASANDAAATLAARIGGSQRAFVSMMNSRAHELGLRHTHYANAIGLDAPGNYSSAEDLVKLTLILRRNEFFRQVTDLPRTTLHTGAHPRTIVNRNVLVRAVAEVNGVKTGHTSTAGYILVGSASKADVTVISVVLDEPTEAARDSDTLALLRYGLRRYHRVEPVHKGQGFASVKLAHRDQHVELVAARSVERTARRDERIYTRTIDVPSELDGPLPAGSRVGTIEVRWRKSTVARVPLITRTAISQASIWERGDDLLGRTLTVVILAIVALASLHLVLLRRRAVRRRRRQAGSSGIA
jgi:D-alanyl-D-alanine carboxypeptidase (penicillin-binding protein 5/6)